MSPCGSQLWNQMKCRLVVFTYGPADCIGFLMSKDPYQRTALMTGLVSNKIPHNKEQSYFKRKGNTEREKSSASSFFSILRNILIAEHEAPKNIWILISSQCWCYQLCLFLSSVICLPNSVGLLLLLLNSKSWECYCLPVRAGKQMLFKATAALSQKIL